MTINVREDIAYILLEKIAASAASPGEARLTNEDLVGRGTDRSEILAHLDYLEQKGFVTAEFAGDAYADKGPNPLPDAVQLEGVELTAQGQQMLKRLQANPPQSLAKGPAVHRVEAETPFLKKVMVKGNLADIYDARDITEVVFRTMRDLMTTDATDRVAQDLHHQALPTDKKALQNEVSELWQDTNPIVRFLSRIRPPLEIDSDLFLRRIQQEGGLPSSSDPELVVKAIFSATKDELPEERIKEIAEFLPSRLRQLWQAA